MAAPGLVRSMSTRTVKKLEKPRPLKQSLSTDNARPSTNGLDNLMCLVESVSQSIINLHYDDNLRTSISSLNSILKTSGNQLESIYKDQLDRAFVSFRNGTRDEGLDYRSRLYLLELIELRAKNWQVSDSYLQSYYNAKMQSDLEIISRDQGISPSFTVQTAVTPTLSPGEVLKNSGKFMKPTKIPGKNYCKDEVVIRNADSGKVNPGAKERLVQITGPTEDKILHARQLMEDTIRRNASPVREMCDRERMGGSSSSLNSSASDESNRLPFSGRGGGRTLLHSLSTPDASIGEYKYSVTVGNDTIKITGTNHDLVRTAKLVLDEHFGPELYQNFRSDCYTHFEEDVFTSNSHTALTKRLGSLDSGNGGPSNSSSGESDDTTCISTLPGDIEGGIGINRQPLFSTSRPVLSRSASVHSQDFRDNLKKKRLEYTIEFLMKCLDSPLTKLPPPDWDRISREFPAIVKQRGSSFFDPEAFMRKRSEIKERMIAFVPIVIDSSPDPEWP